MTLDFERHCAEVVTQTSLLIGHLNGADLTVPVPTCPGWNVSQLARHVDGGQRWAREILATAAVGRPGGGRGRLLMWGARPGRAPGISPPAASPTRPRCTEPTRRWLSTCR